MMLYRFVYLNRFVIVICISPRFDQDFFYFLTIIFLYMDIALRIPFFIKLLRKLLFTTYKAFLCIIYSFFSSSYTCAPF